MSRTSQISPPSCPSPGTITTSPSSRQHPVSHRCLPEPQWYLRSPLRRRPAPPTRSPQSPTHNIPSSPPLSGAHHHNHLLPTRPPVNPQRRQPAHAGRPRYFASHYPDAPEDRRHLVRTLLLQPTPSPPHEHHHNHQQQRPRSPSLAAQLPGSTSRLASASRYLHAPRLHRKTVLARPSILTSAPPHAHHHNQHPQ